MVSEVHAPTSPRPVVSTNVEPGGDRSPPPAFRNGMPLALIAMLAVLGMSIVAVVVSIALLKPPG